MEDVDDEYLDKCSSAICPQCQHKVYFDTLVTKGGVFYFGGGPPLPLAVGLSGSLLRDFDECSNLSNMESVISYERQQEIFDKRLRELTNEAPLARPFLCEGLPMGYKVFLVGINPSKTAPFWPHWDVTTGCNKQEWLNHYLDINDGRYSPTRKRIEILFKALSPIRCLETNIFTMPTPRATDLAASDRDTGVFDFLLETVRPRVVFVHGKPAVKHLCKLTQTCLPYGEFTTVKFRGVKFDVIAGHHLSWHWSYAQVEALGKSLADRYGASSN